MHRSYLPSVRLWPFQPVEAPDAGDRIGDPDPAAKDDWAIGQGRPGVRIQKITSRLQLPGVCR